MNEGDFQARLTDLLTQLGTLPAPARDQIEKLAVETRDRHTRMRKTVGELQDSLDYLRLSIKYLVFDLEATRRENQYLRKLLDRHGNPGGTGECSEPDGSDGGPDDGRHPGAE